MLNTKELEQAKESINNYIFSEFEHDANFEDLKNIPLAYTTITDYEIPIQVSIDLINMKINTYIGADEPTAEDLATSEKITLDEILKGFDFDSLISGYEEIALDRYPTGL